MKDVRDTSNPGARLRNAIHLAGIESVADFAERVGKAPGTIRQQINRHSVPYDDAVRYARALASTDLTVQWLLHRQGPPPRPADRTIVNHHPVGDTEIENSSGGRDGGVTMPPGGTSGGVRAQASIPGLTEAELPREIEHFSIKVLQGGEFVMLGATKEKAPRHPGMAGLVDISAIRMPDGSMMPYWGVREWVYFHRTQHSLAGSDVVIVGLKGDPVIYRIGRLLRESERGTVIAIENPRELRFTFPTARIASMWRVIPHREYDAYR